jgi:quercetin dioxygenase-like cupin family protein
MLTQRWHEMHDETFLVTQGTVRFHVPASANPELAKEGTAGNGEVHIDAANGDYVTVPIRAPHTFSNPFDEQAKFVNTYTPAFYINYFKIIGKYVLPAAPLQYVLKLIVLKTDGGGQAHEP